MTDGPVLTVATYDPKWGWHPSAFALLTGLRLDLAAAPAASDLPAVSRPCCADAALLAACHRFDAADAAADAEAGRFVR